MLFRSTCARAEWWHPLTIFIGLIMGGHCPSGIIADTLSPRRDSAANFVVTWGPGWWRGFLFAELQAAAMIADIHAVS